MGLRGREGTDGNGLVDDEGIPVHLGDYLQGAGGRANEMQGCGSSETGFTQIPREQPEAWGEVLEAANTRLGSGLGEREVERPSNVAAVRIEATGGDAIGVVAEEPDIAAVGEELLVDVGGKVGAPVDDHADGGRGQPGGGSAVRRGDGRTDQMRAPMVA